MADKNSALLIHHSLHYWIMSLVIREATKNDIPFILGLLYELERPKPADDDEVKVFKNKIKDYFSDSQKSIIVAEQDLSIVGLASLIFLQRLNRAKPEMYMPELVVTETKRSVGIGKKLMAFCIEIARRRDCHRIRLESGNMRKKSHHFYTDLGFEQSSLSFSMNIP